MRKISTMLIALLSTLAFSTSAVAEQNPCGNPCAGKKPKPVKKEEAKKEAPPPDTTKEAVAPPAQPEPPAELLAAAKMMKGTWFCKGSMMMPDGTEVKTTATMKWKVDLDKFWLRGDLAVKKMKGMKRGYKAASYRTFSASDSKWYEYSVDNMGGVSRMSSSGPDDTGKVTWDSESTMMGQTMKGRHYEEPVMDKKGKPKKNAVHLWGEGSQDGGKTFKKEYDVTCSK
jgi:hypothetical protein